MFSVEQPVLTVGQVPCDLRHPYVVRIGRTAGEMNSACFPFDHEQQIECNETAFRPDFDGDEIDRRQHVPVCLQERDTRGLLLPIRRWRDAVVF